MPKESLLQPVNASPEEIAKRLFAYRPPDFKEGKIGAKRSISKKSIKGLGIKIFKTRSRA